MSYSKQSKEVKSRQAWRCSPWGNGDGQESGKKRPTNGTDLFKNQNQPESLDDMVFN
jgi:hypothetical protein